MNVDLKGRGRSQDMLVIDICLKPGHLLQYTIMQNMLCSYTIDKFPVIINLHM